MDTQLLNRLRCSNSKSDDLFPIHETIKNAIILINNYFKNGNNKKICLVFPAKEFAAQWITNIMVLNSIAIDYKTALISAEYSRPGFKKGDRLILFNDAVVEWNRIDGNFIYLKYKSGRGTGEIGYAPFILSRLQKAPPNRKSLSSKKRVSKAVWNNEDLPLDKLLQIKTYGNISFQKTRICLVGHKNKYNELATSTLINNFGISEYFDVRDTHNNIDVLTPLFLASSLTDLEEILHLGITPNILVLDGAKFIHDRMTAFSDIWQTSMPTILVTDLSELEYFNSVREQQFDFFNFTSEFLPSTISGHRSPFNNFNEKIKRYNHFETETIIVTDDHLEKLVREIKKIADDSSNESLTNLKVLLVQITNFISRIVAFPSSKQITDIELKIGQIREVFLKKKFWLGESASAIESAILLAEAIVEKFRNQPSQKCNTFKELINQKKFEYIICATDSEVEAVKQMVYPKYTAEKCKILTLADLNDIQISRKESKCLLLGWPKSKNMNKIIFSFSFDQLTLLLYQFENEYFNSLKRWNISSLKSVKPNVTKDGIVVVNPDDKFVGFGDFHKVETTEGWAQSENFDVVSFELGIDESVYSRYKYNSDTAESIEAMRINFEKDQFIYTSKTHKFLVIKNIFITAGSPPKLYSKRIELLSIGDVIAFINTDRDILVDWVEQNINNFELNSVKEWTELWKRLLKEYYFSIGSDFDRLVKNLYSHNCHRHKVTIKAWLFDENRIGPDSDDDLTSIAKLTKSDLLKNNIISVRNAISKMTGWRMQASSYISEKIKLQISRLTDISLLNNQIVVEGLGTVTFLKVTDISNVWEKIDSRYVNRLLSKGAEQ